MIAVKLTAAVRNKGNSSCFICAWKLIWLYSHHLCHAVVTHAIRSLICSREQSGWSHRWLGLDITLSLQWLCPQEIATPFLLVVTPIPAPSNISWQGQITSNVFTQETINWETIVLKPTPFKSSPLPSRIFHGLREDKIETKINNAFRINKLREDEIELNPRIFPACCQVMMGSGLARQGLRMSSITAAGSFISRPSH